MYSKGLQGLAATGVAVGLAATALATVTVEAEGGVVSAGAKLAGGSSIGSAGWAPGAQAAPAVRPVAATRAAAIYLTFDDGPDARWTPRILQVLSQNRATAMFFNIGQSAKSRSDLVRAIRNQGSQVGNHTWNHPQLPRLTNAAIVSQLSRTDAAQGWTRCVRPPYGATNARVKRVITARGQSQQLWTVDTRDWARPGTAAIVRQLLAAKPGANVLMHTGGGDRSQTVAALRIALPKMRAKGYVLRGVPGC